MATVKRRITAAQFRAMRNSLRGRQWGLASALKELRAQRVDKPHHRFSHFEELSAGEALGELEARLVQLQEAARAAASW